MKEKVFGFLLPFIPKNTLSLFTGWLVHRKLPPAWARRSIQWFARRYKIDVAEAERPAEAYANIGEFFIRRLKDGARPIGEGFVVHPCDAVISQSGTIERGTLVQAKGKLFNVDKLLRAPDLASRLEGGDYATYYLCPTDYHRVHSPVTGNVSYAAHIPGMLWPVNHWSVENIDGLFAVNERIVTRIDTARGTVVVVMIGATNVGQITVAYDSDWHSNRPGSVFAAKHYRPSIAIIKGAELGIFHMGSTVVTLFEKGVLEGPVLPGATRTGQNLSFARIPAV